MNTEYIKFIHYQQFTCSASSLGLFLILCDPNPTPIHYIYTQIRIWYRCILYIQVRCIRWSQDDSRLISCSMDGAIYEWNVQACKRENENVLKGCSYTSLAITADLKTTFAVGSDRTLKEINLPESNVNIAILCVIISLIHSIQLHHK